MAAALQLPREFLLPGRWEAFRARMRTELPTVIGIPNFPPMQASTLRARIRVGADVVCERVDVYVDQDYAIPAFVFSPLAPPSQPMPGLVWNPGWPQDKWDKTYQEFAMRNGPSRVCRPDPDHAPFGETTPITRPIKRIPADSGDGHGRYPRYQPACLRAAETMRVGEYLRARQDVDPRRWLWLAFAQGGQDTWLTLPWMSDSVPPLRFARKALSPHIAPRWPPILPTRIIAYPFGI